MMLQTHLQRTEMYPEQACLLRAALDRIVAGSYGHCVKCHAHIGMVRLTAVPHAIFCIPCQENAFYHPDTGNVRIRRFSEESGNNV
jgi:RNA polymerase-binding transcription factor DksA